MIMIQILIYQHKNVMNGSLIKLGKGTKKNGLFSDIDQKGG